jgi:hypothetical protein
MSLEHPVCACRDDCPRALAAEQARDAARDALGRQIAASEGPLTRLAAAEAERDQARADRDHYIAKSQAHYRLWEQVEQAHGDFVTSTHEMLGELLEEHHITPEPCPGGPCVANALLAIGARITAAEQRATRLAALEAAGLAYLRTKSEADWEALGAALAALDAPPAATPSPA